MSKMTTRIFVFLAILVFVSIQTVFVQAQGEIFTETFDDPAMPDWLVSENISGVDGRLVIEGEGYAFHHGNWSDQFISLRFKINGSGSAMIHYQAGDEGGYITSINKDNLILMLDEKGEITEISFTPLDIAEGEWLQLSIQKSGDSHKVYLNDELVMIEIISNHLPPGGILLRVQGELTAAFDDLFVETGSDQVLSEDPPPPKESNETAPGLLPNAELHWLRLGGPPGGLGYDIRYNFDNPNTWYVTDANAGVHISYDNGITWEQSNNGIGSFAPIFSLTVDPHDPQIIWIGTNVTGRIYKSTDGGKNWVEKSQGVIQEFEVSLSFRGFTVDPRTSDIVYAMGELQRSGNNIWGLKVGGVVYKSIDGGENWTRIWNGGIPSSLARYMWINPENPDILYVSTGIFDRGAVGETDIETNNDPFGGLGILKSTDGGVTWRVLGKENGLDFLYIGSLYMHPENPDILFAAAGHVLSELSYQEFMRNNYSPLGIYRTTDGGENWEQVLKSEKDFFWEVFASVDICPSDPNIIYAGSELAIYRSEDGGDTWKMASGAVYGWGPAGVRAGWPIDMQCDPRDPNRIFVNNYGGGNFLSEDGGQTWENASTGYTGALIVNVAVDPFDPAHVYAVGRSGGWHSFDGGVTWNGIHNPGETEAMAGGEMGAVAFDPEIENHIILGGQEAFLEWVIDENRWVTYYPPFEYFPAISEIEFAPSNPRIVYSVSATANTMLLDSLYEGGKGMMVSRDGGSNWLDITGEQFKEAILTDVSIDPTNENVVYVASQIGLFKSEDGGESWKSLSSLSYGEPVRTVAVNPDNPQKIYAGIPSKGFYLSDNGGESWRRVDAGLEPNGNHRDIIFDPNNSMILYVSDILSGVYQSKDGGESWIKFGQGLDTLFVTSLAISSDGLTLYSAASGAGVYRLDLNGQPPELHVKELDEVVEEAEPNPQEEPVEQNEPEIAAEPDKSENESKFRSPCIGGLAPIALVGVGWSFRRKRNNKQ